MSENNTGWQLRENLATFSHKSFAASIDLQFPAKGIHAVEFNGTGGKALSTIRVLPHPPTPKSGETVIESYVRGDDLIVNYAQTPARTARPQIEWSFVESGSAVGIQATIAMQTSLLDSDPTILSTSSLGKGELLHLAADKSDDWKVIDSDVTIPSETLSVFLFRPADSDWSYAEAIYPTDFQGATIRKSNENTELELSLFPEFLEKGVIRKGRIQSLFLPRTGDSQAAIDAHTSLSNAPAPLTT